MFTAEDAKNYRQDDLDQRIEDAVRGSSGNSASIRIYCDDAYWRNIESELERRGFKNIQVPDIILKGDVYFEWDE